MDEQLGHSEIRELRHEVAEVRKEQAEQRKEQAQTSKDVLVIKTTLDEWRRSEDRGRQSSYIWIPLTFSVVTAILVAVVGAWLNGKFK